MKTITARELIERLSELDPEARIIFAADYGDRAHTQQALPVRGDLDETQIRETGYSSSGFALSEGDEDGSDYDNAEIFVVLS